MNAVNQGLRYLQSLKHVLGGRVQFNKRFINLNVFIFALVLIIVLQCLYSYNSSSKNGSELFLLKNEVYSSTYDKLIDQYSPKELKNFNFEKKCNLYFEQLHKQNSNWMFNNYDTKGYDDNYINFQDFLNFKKKAEPNMEFNEKTLIELEKEFNQKSFDSVKVDKSIVDAVSTLRIFSKCFVESNEGFQSSSKNYISSFLQDDEKVESEANSKHELCHDTEARIFPWLTFVQPTFKRWDGEVVLGPPDLSSSTNAQYGDSRTDLSSGSGSGSDSGSGAKLFKRARRSCFMKNWKESINGRGIVISASDGQVDELKRLALILRALNNDLPIQVVHKGDLSEANQNQLIDVFRKPINHDQLPLSSDKLDSNQTPRFPPQDLWFVNVQNSIKDEYGNYFHKYANKLIAYFFNSFEDMLLIDTDTVPFVDLRSIFELPGFVNKGAFFFQDRQLRGSNTENQVNYFKRLFPSKLDTYFFNIPQVTDFTLKNRFIGGLRNHFMESGVVAIKRTSHFSGMLSAIQLNFWSITAKKIHGDKELFWLGQSIAGNENYEFNALGAASVGELTPQENKLFGKTSANELCSNHPGHINGYDNQTLLWMNSGFSYCKNTRAAQFDHGKPLYKQFNAEQLEKKYKGITVIRAGVVPPAQEIDGSNDQSNADKGWNDEHRYCMSYTWCAYDSIGSMSKPEEKGLVVNFGEEQSRVFDFFGDLWLKGLREDKPKEV
ncbi:Alpha-1,3-mannosyltransferase MNN1 [Wickerhamomyces ciferrii]|uniref:Alpha-1,3-mannosyltransferase MNN1 n=1 Tax=Wickerhamomyces ciferrii (strain ATCC 14091 / BCRC 22168 / CBS 111 / JCM 3599 / NBRC 0793 / NRRL Y-1031 F-60-10) TaxID=1206466 RepID=K0KPU5_WICCF|nr:Alpha-1,3-mannosyltransferase MNN1 [Wickerhamomyces ciferrii]CCH43439.1 Alpha-1,3-mannosyltransferase MNN1 [Wickerhamomyces ciferrii]